MRKIKRLLKRGDTILEVTFAISVFSVISILALQIMDRDVAIIQSTLESEMARNEIDAQAEALRFVQNAFLSEKELSTSSRAYQDLWLKLSRGPEYTVNTEAGAGLANSPKDISAYISTDCKTYYNENNSTNEIHNIYADQAFVLNTRKIDPNNISATVIQATNKADAAKFVEAPVYPRIVYTKVGEVDTNEANALSENYANGAANATNVMQNTPVYDQVKQVEGIWVISARDITKGEDKTPEFYDFHIRTCWYAPGHERPSTIATTIRLYNPEFVEDLKAKSNGGK